MTRHGRLSSLRRGALAAGLLLLALLAWSMQRPGAAAAAPATAPPICGPVDCPAAGAPQHITFGPDALQSARRTFWKKGISRAELRVALDAPRGRRAIAIVTSPQGRRWRIARSRTFRPKRFGRWTITGQRIVTGATVTFPQHRSTVVTVRRGGRGTVRVRWVQVVSKRTRVAQESAIRSVARDGAAYVVRLADPDGRVAVGDTLAAGPGEETPQGLLISVTSVRRDGDTAIVTGAQAPLSAIGPQARIAVRPQLEVTPDALAGRGGTLTATTAGANGPAARAAAQPEGAVEKPYKCEGGVAATLKGSLGMSAGSEIGISWGGFWHPLTIRAIAAASVRQSSNLTLRVAGKAKCDLDVDLLSKPIRYSPITFSVGPVPVVITPKLNFHVIAEGSVEGAVETSVRQALDARLGLEWDGKKLIPIKSLNNTFQFSPIEPQFQAGIMAGIGPKLMFDVYEVGGPYLTAEGLMRFEVDSTRDPWWRLSGGFQAGAGIAFQVWRFSFDRNVPDLLSKDWTIAKASGAAPPQLTTTSVPDAVVGAPYGTTLAATAGKKPLTWGIANGALPAGLSLNPSTGAITGTPKADGAFPFTVTVTDANRRSSSRSLAIFVRAPPAVVATTALPDARTGVPYVAQLQGSGSLSPYRWSLAGGTLPAGLTLDPANGTVSGVPSALGTSDFTVALEGRDGQRATRALRIRVDGVALSVPAQTLADAVVEAPYAATLTAEGGSAPYRWAITAGTLPAGLTLAENGRITGTATAKQQATFTVTATDAHGITASRDLTLSSVYPALSVGEQTLLDPMAGQPYSAQLRATGGGAPYTWALTAGTLPSGLTLADDGALGGTPTTEGDSTVTFTATDRFGQTAARELTLTVVPNALEVVTRTLTAMRNEPVDVTLEVRGGRAPYTWTQAPGSSLPSGMTFDGAAGRIGGTPSAAGRRTFAVEVTDADGIRATGSIEITVSEPAALRSVSCPTDAFCATTDYYGGLATWDGSRWSAMTRVTTSTEPLVSCSSPEDCLVMPAYGNRGKVRVDGGEWADTPALPDPVRFVRHVECVSDTRCFVSGTTNERAVIWTWDGSDWSTRLFTSGENPSNNQANMVSCISANNCVAAVLNRVSRWNGATWTVPESVPISYTIRVSCTPGGRCLAANGWGDVTWYNGSTWGNVGSTGSSSTILGCAPDAEFCAWSQLGSGGSLMTWRTPTALGTATTTDAGAGADGWSLDCASDRTCVLVGSYGRITRWNGTAWVRDPVMPTA